LGKFRGGHEAAFVFAALAQALLNLFRLPALEMAAILLQGFGQPARRCGFVGVNAETDGVFVHNTKYLQMEAAVCKSE
jgi:hypothetical protein